MNRILKKQQRTIGAIVKIPLEGDYFGYGRILETKIAIYDIFTKESLPETEILSKRILLIVAVFDKVITKGYWEKISKSIPLEENLKNENLPPMFKQDIFTKKYQLVYPDRFEPATEEQCKGLERWSVWTAEGIENRLIAHYTNKEPKNEIPTLEKELELV
jgi:hypothetical protein